MDPTGKASRMARSRQACVGCKSTKQRCDGPTRIPCRRCELYNLECTYTAATGPTTSRSSGAKPGSAPLPTALLQPRPSDTTERLIDIAERLRNIESTLAAVQLGTVPHPSTSSSHSSPATIAPGVYTFPMVQASVPGIPHPEQMPNLSVSAQVLAPGNPVMIVNDTISLIDRRGSSGADSAGSGDAEGRRMMMGMQLQSPDAILRGVLTPHECDEFFQMFFDKLQPWVMHFDIVKDASSSDMRERSPILFHTILLSTAYYLMENSDRGLDIYCTLTGIVNELIAPLIISAQNEQMNTDLIRSLTCLLLWKPVQFGSTSLASQSLVQAEHASKLNGTSSLVLGGLIFRTAAAVHLPAITNTFARACSSLHSPHSSPDGPRPATTLDPTIIGDLRLWYWLCIIDSHGAITTGRSTQLDVTEALRTTRLFASLNSQPHDVRLAAYVELFGTAKGAISELVGKNGMGVAELKEFNEGMDVFEDYWTEALEEKTSERLGVMRDKWATDVLYVFGAFARVVVNASVYTRWMTDRKPTSFPSTGPPPPLTPENLGFLQRAIASAEHMLFALSMESRSDHNMRIRRVRWRGTGTLKLDREGASCFEGAIDTVICVMYIFVAVFLAKLANAGLMTSSLVLLSQPSAIPPRLEPESKLSNLLLLTSEFLDEIAPTDSHPARKHASILRRILDGGSGQRKAHSRPLAPAAYEHVSAGPPTDPVAQRPRRPHLDWNGQGGPPGAPPPFRTMNSNGEGGGSDYIDPNADLTTVLETLSPSFYNEIGFFDGMDLDLTVDWASLQQGIAPGSSTGSARGYGLTQRV